MADNSKFLGHCGEKIDDAYAKKLAKQLVKDTTITVVNLIDGNIGDVGSKAIAAMLEKNKTIRKISLAQNHIGDKGAKALAAAMKKNAHVVVLTLTENSIGNKGKEAVEVIESICRANEKVAGGSLAEAKKILEKANLRNTATYTALIKNFPQQLKKLENYLRNIKDFKLLKFSPGMFGGEIAGDEMAEALDRELKDDSPILEIDMEACAISDKGVNALAKILQRNRSLESISINAGNISTTGMKALATALKNNTTLKTLCFGEHLNLDDMMGQALAEILTNSKSVVQIFVYGQSVSVGAAMALADAMKKNTTLQKLIFGYFCADDSEIAKHLKIISDVCSANWNYFRKDYTCALDVLWKLRGQGTEFDIHAKATDALHGDGYAAKQKELKKGREVEAERIRQDEAERMKQAEAERIKQAEAMMKQKMQQDDADRAVKQKYEELKNVDAQVYQNACGRLNIQPEKTIQFPKLESGKQCYPLNDEHARILRLLVTQYPDIRQFSPNLPGKAFVYGVKDGDKVINIALADPIEKLSDGNWYAGKVDSVSGARKRRYFRIDMPANNAGVNLTLVERTTETKERLIDVKALATMNLTTQQQEDLRLLRLLLAQNKDAVQFDKQNLAKNKSNIYVVTDKDGAQKNIALSSSVIKSKKWPGRWYVKEAGQFGAGDFGGLKELNFVLQKEQNEFVVKQLAKPMLSKRQCPQDARGETFWGLCGRTSAEAKLSNLMDEEAEEGYQARADKNKTDIFLPKYAGKDFLKHIHEGNWVKKLNIQELFTAFAGLANEVKAMHDKGIIHRDLKPNNVMYDPNTKVWRIIDMGNGYKENFAAGKAPSGSAAYIPPGLIGYGELHDVKSDIYALGAIYLHVLMDRANVDMVYAGAKYHATGGRKDAGKYGIMELFDNLIELRFSAKQQGHVFWHKELLKVMNQYFDILKQDPNTKDEFAKTESVWRIILRTMSEDPKERPELSEITQAFQQFQIDNDAASRLALCI